jgi:Zn-finger protein
VWSIDSEYSKTAKIVGRVGHSVLSPTTRPDEVPNVTSISGIKKKYFCFMRISHNEIGARKFSCDCQPCMAAGANAWNLGKKCENFDKIGPWKRHRVLPDNGTWRRIYDYLENEGRNVDEMWNDVCGCMCSEYDGYPEMGCGEGGTLLQCTYCYNAFHMSCVGLCERKKAPSGVWACPACVIVARDNISDDISDDSTENDSTENDSTDD